MTPEEKKVYMKEYRQKNKAKLYEQKKEYDKKKKNDEAYHYRPHLRFYYKSKSKMIVQARSIVNSVKRLHVANTLSRLARYSCGHRHSRARWILACQF